MPKIVIAGAGPIGLYTAIILRVRYPDVEIMLLDERIDNFNRPGVIATNALVAINASFEMLGIPTLEVQESGCHPPATYIRDLQNALYERAKNIGITLINSHYSAVKNKNVKTDLAGSLIGCNLLIDCTGDERAVITPKFEVKNIAENPIKNHLIAYIYVDSKNDELLKHSSEVTPETLSAFRNGTEWQEFIPPEIDPRRWGPVEYQGRQYAAKYCIYAEMPNGDGNNPTNKNARIEYLRALLKLKYGRDIEFTASNDPGSFNKFEVSPKTLKHYVGEIDSIPVVALGDALVSAEYRYGTGIENGVAEAYMLTDSLDMSKEQITVNEDAWLKRSIDIPLYGSRNVEAIIGEHRSRIQKDYESKKIVLFRAINYAYAQYKNHMLEASPKDLQLFADFLKQKGDDTFRKKDYEASRNFYLEALSLYKMIYKHNLDVSNHVKTLSMLGKVYFQTRYFDEAVNFFEKAKSLAEKHNVQDMLAPEKLPKFLSEAKEKQSQEITQEFRGRVIEEQSDENVNEHSATPKPIPNSEN